MTIPGGTAIGSIVVEERIRTGAYGELYLARQPGLDRNVLLRKLRRDLLQSRDLVDRFRREARLSARVQHRGIVQVFDFFAERGDHYIVLEHVDGPTLRDVLDRIGMIPARIVNLIALEMTRAIGELHRRGIIHCELQPDNISISRWGDLKISGLGGAREVGEEATPASSKPSAYTAPELARGEPADPRADVYSVGAILFELLGGRAPDAEGVQQPAAPRSLQRLLRKCLAQNPEDRPKIGQLIKRLESLSVSRKDGRVEIAAWLWEVRVLRPRTQDVHADTEPESETEPKPRNFRWRIPPLALPVAGATVALLLGFLMVRALVNTDGTAKIEATPAAKELPAVASSPPTKTAIPLDPAEIRFVVLPWAEIQIDDADPFLTPHAAAIPLEAGRHQLIFKHPRFGSKTEVIDLEPGETRLIRHVFSPVGLP